MKIILLLRYTIAGVLYTYNNDEMKIELDRMIKVETSQLEGESEGQIF